MRKVSFFIFLSLILICLSSYARTFKIVVNNSANRNKITDTIQSGGFVIGLCDYGGGYVAKIELPEIGNIMGTASQRYGRGWQSSIRDMVRKGCYNPTQAGYSDNAGTECQVTKTVGKMVVEPRGCVLYNGDGGFDYTRWENIIADPYQADGGSSDLDNVSEENISVNVNGIAYTNQEAEVYSDFDFYGEYENYKDKVGLDIPCVHHYLEYRFIRSSLLPNSPLKQFNEASLTAQGYWDKKKELSNIAVSNPIGVFPSDENHLNRVVLSSTVRNDSEIWDPEYRYVQLLNKNWEIQTRSTQFEGNETTYKLRFIIADSSDENQGHALGFYRPDSYINKFNVVGVKESTNVEAYVDNRIINNFYLDTRYRTTDMSQIGFRNESSGLISRGYLTAIYDGIYEKLRQESFLLYGTPAQLKAAFDKLDMYYENITEIKMVSDDFEVFNMSPNPAKDMVTLNFNQKPLAINIYNLLGKLVYSNKKAQTKISIPTSQIGCDGIYFVTVNNATQKLILSN